MYDYKSGELFSHLLQYGFMEGYTRWTSHGEEAAVADDNDGHTEAGGDSMDHEEPEGDMEETVADMVKDTHLREQIEKEKDTASAAKREKDKYESLLKDSQTPLYPGCDEEDTRLSFALEMLRLKAASNSTDTSLDLQLQYLCKVMPKDNKLPRSCDEAKKIVCPLGLDVKRYHACPNDCIIYRKEYENLDKCPRCQASRFKRGREPIEDAGKRVTKGTPAKVVWHLPLTPRLKRLFANKKDAQLMRWHATRHKVHSEVLRHPADGSQWQSIDAEYHEFGKEPRNVRLGMSTDGLNPFGNMSCRFSTWPVVVWMYNLPPWLCLKRKYIHLCFLIQGPRQPGNDLNMYHELLYEELRALWDGPPVEVWDAYGKNTLI